MSETIGTNVTAPESPAEKKPFRWGVALVWAAIIGLLALLGWGLINSSAPRPEIGRKAPTFNMEFFNGYEWEGRKTANLEDLQGKVVVLNFWASWCVECRVEADLLEQTYRAYKDDVVFLGIAYVDVEPESLKYLEEFDITYPNAPDLGTRIARDYNITGVPETFIIDQNGEIADVVIGPVNEGRLISTLNSLLSQGG
jgi:cytochrome c biogenesis protein CcmG/thiol:disulfide interchange protein DsbE